MIISLGGIRIRDDSQQYWPWDEGVTLAYQPVSMDENYEVRFNVKDLDKELDLDLEILSDSGDSILAVNLR